uniref:Uncharacterized protein n=1 Tax=mine drainage metagenome TaxID=410659 RepID=E6PRD0_9ZZZZ
MVGFAAGDIPRIALNLALLKERQILGVYWGEAVQRDPMQHASNVRQLLQWFAAASVRPEITEQVTLDLKWAPEPSTPQPCPCANTR